MILIPQNPAAIPFVQWRDRCCADRIRLLHVVPSMVEAGGSQKIRPPDSILVGRGEGARVIPYDAPADLARVMRLG